jgi:protein ImuB
MERFACLVLADLPLATALRAEPELAEKRVAIVEQRERKARSTQSPTIVAGSFRGLTVAQARAVEPALEVRSFSLEGMRSAEQALLDVATSVSPRVMSASPGLVFIDLAGTQSLFPTERGLLTALETRLGDVGFALAREAGPSAPAGVRLGIGPTRTVAELAARHREGGRILRAEEAASFLVPLPLDLLDPPTELASRLTHWGVRTLGQLARIPRDALGGRLGEAGVRLARRANGEDLTPFRQHPPLLRFEEVAESDWAIANLEPLSFLLRALCERLVRRVRLRGLALRRLRLELGLESGAQAVRELGLAAPTLETHVLLGLARLELERHPPAEGVLSIRAIATPDSVETAQLDLFLPPLPSPGELAVAIARIESLCGAGQVGAPRVEDTHQMDAAALVEFRLAHERRRESATRESREPPHRGVIALRALRPPRPVRVYGAGRTRAARPGGVVPGSDPPVYVSLSLRAEEGEGGRVLHTAGPWRLFGEWWGESRFARDYWDVELSDGGLYRLYHDLASDSWFADGIYD